MQEKVKVWDRRASALGTLCYTLKETGEGRIDRRSTHQVPNPRGGLGKGWRDRGGKELQTASISGIADLILALHFLSGRGRGAR